MERLSLKRLLRRLMYLVCISLLLFSSLKNASHSSIIITNFAPTASLINARAVASPPPLVSVSNTSGLAGIAHWINTYFHLSKEESMDKNSELVKLVKVWVDEQYDEGRVTVITDSELLEVISQSCEKLGIPMFKR